MAALEARHLAVVVLVLVAVAYYVGGQHKLAELQGSGSWFQAGYDCERLGLSDRYLCRNL